MEIVLKTTQDDLCSIADIILASRDIHSLRNERNHMRFIIQNILTYMDDNGYRIDLETGHFDEREKETIYKIIDEDDMLGRHFVR